MFNFRQVLKLNAKFDTSTVTDLQVYFKIQLNMHCHKLGRMHDLNFNHVTVRSCFFLCTKERQ